MLVSDFFGLLRRRWLLLLVGFLITVGLTGAAYGFFKPTYEITGTVLLLPPQSSSASGDTNPYLRLNGLRQAVDLVGLSLSDQSTQQELKAISKDADFTVLADVRTSSPVLVIDVKDSTPDAARRIRDILVARAPVRLEAMQKALGVSPSDRVTTTVLTLDAEAMEVGKNRLRAAVVAACVGLGLTLLTATQRDVRRLRHPRRSKPARQTDPDDAAPSSIEATVRPDEATAGATASPVSPVRAVEPLEEPADAPDNVGH